jgi:DNA repair protein RecO (recombination protein O)
MEETYRTKAVILKRTALGENNSRVTVYTEDRGRLDLLARGTKTVKSKLAGHLEPLCLSEIMVVRGRRQNYIGAAVSENCFGNLKADLRALTTIGGAVGTFLKLVREEEADRTLFFLLKGFLSAADNSGGSGVLPGPLSHLFVFKLFCHLGHKPELYNCVTCRLKITPGNNLLDLRQGGVLCVACRPEVGGPDEHLMISDGCIKILRVADKGDLAYISGIKISEKLADEMKIVVNSYMQYNFN